MAEQQITTAEDIRALPQGWAMRGPDGTLWDRMGSFCVSHYSQPKTIAEVVAYGPFTALAPAPVDQGDREALARVLHDAGERHAAEVTGCEGQAWESAGEAYRAEALYAADAALAWFAAQPKTVTAEEVEALARWYADELARKQRAKPWADDSWAHVRTTFMDRMRTGLRKAGFTVEGGAE